MWSAALFAVAARAAAPVVPAPTPADRALLDDGQMVMVYSSADGRTSGLAMLHVNAPPEAVIAAVIDVRARLGEVEGLRSVDVYEQTADRISAHYAVGVAMVNVDIYTRYELHLAEGWVGYAGDPDRESDITGVSGWYRVVPDGDGALIAYLAESDTRGVIPVSLRRTVSERAAGDQLVGMRRRAEAAVVPSPGAATD